MKKAIFPIVLVCIILVFLVIQSFVPVTENNEQQLIAKANQFNQLFPQEKVYLQLDRSSYWLGDTIWFKAYLQNSPSKDCDLNVELANMYGVVISRKRCFVRDGLAYGDISLPDTLSSGMFEIRAYTNWMRNFDEQYFFRKQLIIWNQVSRKTLRDPRELKRREVDLQFMPEGGTFVAGQRQRMAFKATDQNGLGVKIEGQIVDRKGNEVMRFGSLFKGMGHFLITPKEGEKYKAKVIINGEITMNVDLPEVQAEGFTLSANTEAEDSIRVRVFEKLTASNPDANRQYLLLFMSNGKVLFSKKIALSRDSLAFCIGKDKLPTGITQLTLFDGNLLPRCERLVFVNHHDQVTVKIEPEKGEYHQRDKMILDLYALDKEENPLLANLSISVFNTDNQLELEKYPENILTRFLFSSELKGNVESPAYYFKDDSLTTLQALDNLMLTQGYRCYTWQAILNDQFPEIAYFPDRGIKIRGTVKTATLKKKAVSNTDVNLLFLKTNIGFKHAQTDSLGRFEFPGYFFRDTVSLIVTGRNPAGKKESQKDRTLIELDKKAYQFPDYQYLARRYQSLGYGYDDGQKVSISNSFSQEDLLKINRKWKLTDTIMLNEIRVMKRKLTPGVRPLRLYDQADYVLDIDEDDDDLENVFLKLWQKFPKVPVRIIGDNIVSVNINYSYSSPILVIDGLVTNSSLFGIMEGDDIGLGFVIKPRDIGKGGLGYLALPYIPQGLVDKIEVIENARPYGNFMGGAICVFTKGRMGIYADMPGSIGMKSANIIGYSVAHKFYSPKYEVKKPNEIKDDFRNTLCWNPAVQTDKNGETWIEFYNSDQSGEVLVIVEGMTKDGKICRGEYKYDVTR